MSQQPRELVVSFRADGSVEALHDDHISLAFLGAQNIKRASDIRFNTYKQVWQVWICTFDVVVVYTETEWCFATYDAARRFEVTWLNACRLHNETDPLSAEGLFLGKVCSEGNKPLNLP